MRNILYSLLFVVSCVEMTPHESRISEIKSSAVKQLHRHGRSIDSSKKMDENVMKKSLTKVMLQLYNTTSSDIIGFTPEVKHYTSNKNGTNQFHIWYNVSELSFNKNQLDSAELRFYKRAIIDNNNYTISVNRKLSNGQEQLDVHREIISGNHEGWITMNLTETLKSWLDDADDDGLYLMAESESNGAIDVGDAGIVEADAEIEPFVVVFLHKHQKENQEKHLSDEARVRRTRNLPRDSNLCEVRPWNVRFEDIFTDEIILVPKEYNANLCGGQCHNQNIFSFHSQVQYYAHNSELDVPSVQCIPTEFSNISILYWNNDHTRMIKEDIASAVIEKCACM